jgi:hypothetical protein
MRYIDSMAFTVSFTQSTKGAAAATSRDTPEAAYARAAELVGRGFQVTITAPDGTVYGPDAFYKMYLDKKEGD